jgi:hypothetical protein
MFARDAPGVVYEILSNTACRVDGLSRYARCAAHLTTPRAENRDIARVTGLNNIYELFTNRIDCN